MSEQLVQLKEATQALLWTILWTIEDAQDAPHGGAEERAKNRIREAISRVNHVWQEEQKCTSRKKRVRRKVLW